MAVTSRLASDSIKSIRSALDELLEELDAMVTKQVQKITGPDVTTYVRFRQAYFLAQEKDAMKPAQANLRRSISASYYTVFHLLIDEATKLMLPERNQTLRDCCSTSTSP